MRLFERLCPAPPDWMVPWEDIRATFPWVGRMAETPQDPEYHAEGDVATHTRMAVEALATLPQWRAKPDRDRVRLFAAVLLHDVGKPDVTRTGPDGRLASAGHSGRGEVVARRVLWEQRVPIADREHVAALIKHHQLPLWALERPDLERLAVRASILASNGDLALLATADILGRHCRSRDAETALENIGLFQEYCDDLGVLAEPWPFTSDHARFRYFRTPGRDPRYAAYDDTVATVTIMSGFPGVGKDTWIEAHLADQPVVSLDALRARLGIAPTGDQRPVVAAAYDQARQYLRAHQSFVWNATNVSRQRREACVTLAANYRARVEIVVLEASQETIHTRNSGRARPVPPAVIDRLIDQWESPDLTEAHAIHRNECSAS